jgi:hypothetical protein
LLLILVSLTSLAAQDTPTAGDKVRVTTDSERVVGRWVSLDGNRLRLRSEDRDSSLVLAFASVTKLEVSRGQQSRAGRGALIGLAAGAGVGAVLGTLAGIAMPPDVCSGDGCVIGVAAIGAAAGGAAGTLVGLTVGAFITSERWESVPLDEIQVGLSPFATDGVAVSVSLRF